MKAITISVAKKLLYVFAALIILSAILVTITHVFIPALDNNRPEFEKRASEILGAPIKINKARLSWYRYQPEISLDDLTLYDPKTALPSFHLKRLDLFVSIPQSIWQRKLVFSGVMLSGGEVTLVQKENGEMVARELSQLKDINAGGPETKVEDILGWLMSQPRLMLRDIDLHFEGFTGQKRYVTFKRLRFDNDKSDHMVLAKAVLNQDVPTEVSLVVHGVGDISQPEKMKINAYVYFAGLSLSQWAGNAVWHDWRIDKGIGSAKIWINWDNNSLQKVQSIFQVYDLQLTSTKNKVTHLLNRFSADVGWKREGNQQIFAADDVLVDMQEHLWPVSDFYAQLEPNSTGELVPKKINIGYFNIADVVQLMNSFQDAIPANVNSVIKELNPSGNVNSVSLTFADNKVDWQHASIKASLAGVNFSSWHTLPAVTNLSCHVYLDQHQAVMNVKSKNMVIDYDKLFNHPIWINKLTGNLAGTLSEHGWSANIEAIKIVTNDISVNASGSITQTQSESPYMDMQANFHVDNIKNLTRYLPMKAFKPGLVEWITPAFIDGQTENGHGVIRGRLSDFPFKKKDGIFTITTNVKDINLLYASKWPALNHINGNVEFSSDTININVASAQIMGIDAKNIKATIANLGDEKPSMLSVSVNDIAADFEQGIRFVKASPLDKTIGKMFHDMTVKGPMRLDMDLLMPLADTDKTKVKGNINLKNALMSLDPWNLQLKDVTGDVHFTEKTTSTDKLHAELFNKPIDFALKTISKGADSFLRVTTSYAMSVQDLQTWLKIPFSKVVTGTTALGVQLDLSFDEPIEIHVNSNLQGVKVDLPEPYSKDIQKQIKFSSDITIAENKPMRMKLNYGDLLDAALIVSGKQNAFNLVGATIAIGEGAADWPKDNGLYITGTFDKLDMEKIKSYSTQSGGQALPGLKLKNIDLQVKLLELLGQKINDVNLQITPDNSMWNVSIASRDVSGQITMPADLSSNGRINAHFDKLFLNAAQESVKSEIEVDKLPAINFSANNVSINKVSLGQVSFNMEHRSTGMLIRSLAIQSPTMTLQASGDWLKTRNDTRTHLQGSLKTRDVTALLRGFTFNMQNFVATKGELQFDLSWPGAPFSPSLSKLDGTASLEMGSGRIIEIGEASGAKMDLGRLLSIFSLQTIPRRLSLDFSDLFQKGYTFDSLRGKFKFNDGDIYTTNTMFEGPVAGVAIAGRIGVAHKDIDLALGVTPHVASSLPIAATLISGPIVGLAALAVNTVVSAAVSQVASYHYSVKGSWDNPVWGTIESKNQGLQKRR